MMAEKFIDKNPLAFTIKDNINSGEDCASSNEGLATTILNNLNRYPDFVGQINTITGERTTFAEIRDRSIRCALWLKKQKLGENDVVCTSMPLQNDDYIPILAAFFAGTIINPWYHKLTPAEAISFFRLVEPKIIFASEESIDMLVAAAKDAEVNCKFVVFGSHPRYQSLTDLMAQQSHNEVENFRIVEPKQSQIGGMFFSSGTTGNQKCTMLSYNTLLGNRVNNCNVFTGMKMMWYSSYSWISGTSLLISCLTLCYTRILHPEFDVEETSRIIEKYKVNWLFITPTMMTRLWNGNVYKKYNYSELKVMITGGSKSNKMILENTRKALPNCLVITCYGMTEIGGLAVIQTKNCKIPDSVGYVVGGVDVKVVDTKTGNKLGPNETGEICFKSEYVMFGYLKNDEETKSMIDKEGWLHTGDLGYYSEDGELVIVERIKQVIITQNQHVSPSQIEEILLKHPAIVDAAVVPVPHEIDVERPFAFVVKKSDVNVTTEELVDLATTYNEFFRLTGGVNFIDEIPYTPNGKKNVRELKERARISITAA